MPKLEANRDCHERAWQSSGEKTSPLRKKSTLSTWTQWDELAREKNLTEEILKNIVIEVEQNKPELEWLER